MIKFFPYLFFILLSGCTYSITMVHTSGIASDVVDEQQTPTADVKPDIKVSSI